MSQTQLPDIVGDLTWRGLIHQSTDSENLANWLTEKSRALYAGFDPTADSLHVGSLLPLMTLRRFQQAGHRPVALIGGATGMIGDPSGKSDERTLLSEDTLQTNVEGLQEQVAQFLDFECGKTSAVVVNNYQWMKDYSYLNFLRDIGKNFPVNVMLAKDSVKNRLERTDTGLSYTEFSYMLLQAYDFVVLRREFDCYLQIGGSDQWGNITAGIDLARRMDQVQLYGLTCPLLLDSNGEKYGKTASGEKIWLSPERTSPYAFYQFWINAADDDVGRLLQQLTELSHEEIESLDASRAQRPGARESQKRLASELTELVHGTEGLQRALRATEIFFGAEIKHLSDGELSEIFADVHSIELPRSQLEGDGLPLAEAFTKTGLAKSKGEVRRKLAEGGLYVNNARRNEDRNLTAEDLASETVIVLRWGKKVYGLLKFLG